MPNKKSCVSNFGLNHVQPWLFYGPRCNIPMTVYAFYRILLAGYFVTIYVWNMVFKSDQPLSQMAYVTMWSYFLQTITMALKMIITFDKSIRTKCRRPDQTLRGIYPLKMHWYLQLEWLLNTLSTVIPLTITVDYWIYITKNMETFKSRVNNEPLYWQFAIQMHAVNSIFSILDLLMSSVPIQLLHFYQPMLLHVFYFVFEYLIYAGTGNENISTHKLTDVKARLTDLSVTELTTIACFVFVWMLSTLQTKCCCKIKEPMNDRRDFGIYDVRAPLLHGDQSNRYSVV